MLLTLCTIHQLPLAFALVDSFLRYTPSDSAARGVLIGLADDPDNLPAGFTSPHPLLFLRDVLPAGQLAALSEQYTPVEFVAACKPLFIAEAFERNPAVAQFLYADPAILFFADTTPVWSALSTATILLTPHLTRSPGTGPKPDKPDGAAQSPAERHVQNVGLFSSDFMAFRRSDETRRMLAWWQDRATSRARIDFCAGLCLDQLWLMHVPVFFQDVVVVRQPGWHVALWNLTERPLRQTGTDWHVTTPHGSDQPLLFVNHKGLLNPDEGLFTDLNHRALVRQAEISALVGQCRAALARHSASFLFNVAPAYGNRPVPVVLRGWRHQAVRSMRSVTRFIEQVSLHPA